MAELKRSEIPAFLAKARIRKTRVVEVFFVVESRNEWVNWDGDTDVVSRNHSQAHPSSELAEAQAERSRIQGSVFDIRHTVALSIECNLGSLLVYQVSGLRPLAALLDEISAINSVKNVAQWISKAVERTSAGHILIKLACYETKDMPGFKTYQPGSTFFRRTSRAGGRKNGLAWALRPVDINASAAEQLARAIKARLTADKAAGETLIAAVAVAEAAVRVTDAAETRMKPSAETVVEPAIEASPALVTQPSDTALDTSTTSETSIQLPPPEAPLLGEAPDETTREQVALARVGQGLFRRRLEAIERACRLTGVTNKAHLRASHIKPWHHSNATERLDGNNGLLLSPHVDHLFDAGYIGFTNDGTMLVAQELDRAVLMAWHIEPTMNVGPFNLRQCQYLEYHRAHIFRA